MALLRKLFRINLVKIDSDFILLSKKFKNKKLLFVDLGCRGENPKHWNRKGNYIKYVGIDASEKVIQDLKNKYNYYSGNVDASFINAIVSNNDKEQIFASSSEGMCDGLVIDKPEDNINDKDITLTKVKPVKLQSLLKDYENLLDDPNIIKILKIDIEGHSSSIVDDKILIGKFDIVLAEILPLLKNQYSTFTNLEENNFQLKSLERAFQWSKSSSKELFIIDTEWNNKNSNLKLEKPILKKPNFLIRSYCLIVYIIIKLLYLSIKRKSYSPVSDSELGW